MTAAETARERVKELALETAVATAAAAAPALPERAADVLAMTGFGRTPQSAVGVDR